MQEKSVYDVNVAGIESALSVNKVLRNTYMLLAMTLTFSAVCAGISMAINLPPGAALIFMLIGFGLLFVVNRLADTSKGILAIFAFTGVMGASIGPMLNAYMAMPGGPSLVMQALAGTALVFFTLSAYVLTSKKDFSFLGGFLMTGLIIMIVASIASLFLKIAALQLTISSGIVLIMSGLILYDTSRIINGGETNYIRATVSLYLNIYNIFIHLLHLLTAFGGDD